MGWGWVGWCCFVVVVVVLVIAGGRGRKGGTRQARSCFGGENRGVKDQAAPRARRHRHDTDDQKEKKAFKKCSVGWDAVVPEDGAVPVELNSSRVDQHPRFSIRMHAPVPTAKDAG